jgi:tetratricopeptide (TPR) repeat protein
MPLGNIMSFLKAALPGTPTMKFVSCVSIWQPVAGLFILIVVLLLSVTAQAPAQESATVRLAKEADQSLSEHDYDRAIADYKRIVHIDPSSAAAWSNLGAAWFAKGNLSQASGAFEHAASLQPANRDYAFNAALALVREDKCDASAKYLKQSLLSPQRRAGAQYLLGLCAFVSQNWQEAKESLLSAEAVGSESAETYYMLTIAARKSRDPEQAKRAFDILRSKFPDSSLLHELIGELSDQSDTGADALKEMTLAISDSPTAPGLHAKLGFLLWKAHRSSDAEVLFQQELAIDPHSYSAMHYLGDIAEKNNQLPQALVWYERALREQPQSGEAHFAAGRVLELEGRSEDALRELRASFPTLEGDASAHYWTAEVLKKLGMKEQANLELSKVQEINSAERDVLLTKLSGNEH